MRAAIMEKPGLGIKMAMVRQGMQMRRRGTSALMRLSRLRALKDELELSDDQVQKILEIDATLVHNLVKLSAEIRMARFDALKTIISRPVNFEQVRANAKNVVSLRLQRKLAVIDAFEKGAKVLSDDQRDQLSDIMSGWADDVEDDILGEEEEY